MKLQVMLMRFFERSSRIFSNGRNLMRKKNGICTRSGMFFKIFWRIPHAQVASRRLLELFGK